MTTANLTLEELIRATESCGSGINGSCANCPLHDRDIDFECIENLMQQASAALRKYASNGEGKTHEENG